MNNQAQSPGNGADEPIVSRDYIFAAVQAAAEKDPADAQELIVGEPLLSEYLRCGVLEVVGKLALAGAGHALIENVAADMFRLVNVAAGSTRDAYRGLLDGFLPDAGAATANGEPGNTPPPDTGTDQRTI